MPIIFDGFDDREIMNNGDNLGEYYNGFGLYSEVWDGSYDNLVEHGITQSGRYDGKGCLSLPETIKIGYEYQNIYHDLGAVYNYFAFGFATQSYLESFIGFKYNTPGGRVLELDVDYTGALKIWITNNSSTFYPNFVGRQSVWGWNYIWGECCIGLGAGTDYFRLWVNGEQVLNITGVALGNTGSNLVGFPDTTVRVDDVYLRYGNSPLSDYDECRVLAMFPISAGSHTGFTPIGSANNWENVDELIQDFDATYNEASASGTRDSFTFSSMLDQITVGSVHAVEVRVLCEATAGESIKPFVKIGGTRYYGSDYAPASDHYLYCHHVWELNPATGVAWLLSELASVEAGYEIV